MALCMLCEFERKLGSRLYNTPFCAICGKRIQKTEISRDDVFFVPIYRSEYTYANSINMARLNSWAGDRIEFEIIYDVDVPEDVCAYIKGECLGSIRIRDGVGIFVNAPGRVDFVNIQEFNNTYVLDDPDTQHSFNSHYYMTLNNVEEDPFGDKTRHREE